MLPATRQDHSITVLLGTPVPPPNPWLRARRPMRWGLALGALLLVGTPAFLWARYQSRHVTSTNAAVRGHLAEIGGRLTGLVTRVEVDVGDRVVEGQVLVRLENRHLLAEVQAARAEVEGLRRTIEIEGLSLVHERRRISQDEEEATAKVAAAEAQTEEARIRAVEARHDHETRTKLYEKDGVVSSEDVRNAESRRQAAQARLEEARANSAAARSQGKTVRLEGDALSIEGRRLGVLESDVARAEARLARAEADVEGTVIRAPADGAIVRRIVQPGGSVEAGRPILSMWLGRDVWVEAWVDEDDIGYVRLGGVARVTFHSFPGREFNGVVDKIGLATDLEMPDTEVPQPRSQRMRGAPVVGVRIRLDDPPLDLLPGLSAVVAIRKTK